ncbi:hypothetical protein [Lutibacter sp.]|uniref:hypothetical protein n=1 Tax=Lutibacter sp. TaxID=1925666 RepID=UPI003561FCB7
MAYEEKKYESDKDFEWAIRESDSKEIHITDLSAEEKGKKGYRCLGANCGNQLIAVPVRKNPKHKPYFKHAPINILNGEVKCSFSNAEYREALASSILTGLRRIKVPPIYKVNPENPDEYKLIEESKYIDAFSVQSQVTFFEDEEGNIHWGKKPNIKNRFIIRRPDVVFFNEKGNPVLFIELVITHKLDDDKIADLYRLGIDTIQVKVPISSAEEIEKNFHSIKNIKWVYNEREATANYVQIPRRDNQRILDPDEFEKRLFKESFRCRVFRIGDLIRAIRKSLGSKSYSSIEQFLNSEISRVERNTERAKQRLGQLEEQHRAESRGRNSSLEEKLRTEEKELSSDIESAEQRLGDLEESNRRDALSRNRDEEEKIESKYTGLERRYLDKDRDLEQGMRDYIRAQDIGIPIERDIEREEKMVWKLERDARHFEQEITERFRNKFKYIENEIRRVEEEQRNLEKTIQSEIVSEIDSTERSIRNIREHQSRIEGEIWGEFKNEIEFEDSEIERLIEEENEFEETIRDEFHRELKESSRKLPKGIKVIMDAERLGSTFSEAKRENERYKRAYELFRKGTWEKG